MYGGPEAAPKILAIALPILASPLTPVRGRGEDAGLAPRRPRLAVRNVGRERDGIIVEPDRLGGHDARLIHVVARGVIAVGTPLLFEPECFASGREAEFECERRNACSHETILVGADETVSMGKGVRNEG